MARKRYTPTLIRILEKIFIESWGLVLFLFLCFCLHQYLSQHQNKMILQLQLESQVLNDDILQEKKRQRSLQEQNNSHHDHLWNERVLKKELGLKGKDEKKIYFTPSPGMK